MVQKEINKLLMIEVCKIMHVDKLGPPMKLNGKIQDRQNKVLHAMPSETGEFAPRRCHDEQRLGRLQERILEGEQGYPWLLATLAVFSTASGIQCL